MKLEDFTGNKVLGTIVGIIGFICFVSFLIWGFDTIMKTIEGKPQGWWRTFYGSGRTSSLGYLLTLICFSVIIIIVPIIKYFSGKEERDFKKKYLKDKD